MAQVVRVGSCPCTVDLAQSTEQEGNSSPSGISLRPLADGQRSAAVRNIGER